MVHKLFFCDIQNNTVNAISLEKTHRYSNSCLSRKIVEKWFADFKTGDSKRSNRSKEVVTLQNIKRIPQNRFGKP